MMDFDAIGYLKQVQEQSDDTIDLAVTAACMASLIRTGVFLGRYVSHATRISEEVSERHNALIESGAPDDVAARLAALKHVLSDVHDYHLSEDRDEILEAADILRTIDRKCGRAETVCVLYIQAARAQGWAIEGLRFPDYFVCRMEKDGVRLVFDPGRQCRILEARDLRAIVKDALGPKAEMSADYLCPLTMRQVLIHVHNFLKLRLIEMGDYETALRMIEAMRLIDPDEYRLWLDSGVLRARTGKVDEAIRDLEGYLTRESSPSGRRDAVLLLSELRGL